jgi:hypothetical protein
MCFSQDGFCGSRTPLFPDVKSGCFSGGGYLAHVLHQAARQDRIEKTFLNMNLADPSVGSIFLTWYQNYRGSQSNEVHSLATSH